MNIRPLPCPPDLHAERDAIAKAVVDAMTSSGEFDGGLAWACDNDTRVAWYEYVSSHYSAGWSTNCTRQRIPGVKISQSGGKVRIKFGSGQNAGCSSLISSAFFGKAATTGNPWDFAETPVQLTFDGSASYTIVGENQTVKCDAFDFDLDPNCDYILGVNRQGAAAATSQTVYDTGKDEGYLLYYNNSDDGGTVAPATMSLMGVGYINDILSIEVSGAEYNETGGYLQSELTPTYLGDDTSTALAQTVSGSFTCITGHRVARKSGYIKSVTFYTTTAGANVKVKVFRKNGTNFDFIGESATVAFDSSGEQTKTLSAPLRIERGDYIGFYSDGDLLSSFNNTSASSDEWTYYINSDVTSDTAIASFTYDDASVIAFGVDIDYDSDDCVIDLPSSAITEVVDSYETPVVSATTDIYGAYHSKGQVVTLTEGKNITGVAFKLQKIGSPTGSFYARATATTGTVGSSGTSDGVILGQSEAQDVSLLSTTAGWVYIPFPFPVSKLTSVAVYIYYSGGDASNCIRMYADSSGTHSGDYMHYNAGWSYNASWDAMFKLHAEKYPRRKMVDGYAASNQDTYFNLIAGGTSAVGQAFGWTPGDHIQNSRLYLCKIGTVSGDVSIKLYAADGILGSTAKPTGTAIATKTIPATSLSTSFALVCVDFGGIKLDGDKYVVVAEYGGTDSSNCVRIGIDGSSPAHASNCARYLSSAWQAETTYDVCFEVYGYTARDTRRVQPYLLHSGGDYRNDVRVDVGNGEKVVKDTGATACSIGVCQVGSGISGGDRASYPSSYAFDGDMSTIWYSSQTYTGIANVSYVGIDFGQIQTLTSLRYYTAPNSLNGISAIDLQGSLDGVTWNTIKSYTGLTITASTLVTLDGFSPYDARYVRLLAKSSTSAAGNFWGIADIEPIIVVHYSILRAPLQRIDRLKQAMPQCRVHLRNNVSRLNAVALLEWL